MFLSMAPVVRAGDDGWSVMVHDAALERAATRDGNAVPWEVSLLVSRCGWAASAHIPAPNSRTDLLRRSQYLRSH